MPTSREKLLDEVLKWETHPAFCRSKVTLTNSSGAAFAKGASLLGQVALFTSATAATIRAAATDVGATDDLGIVIKKERLTAELADSGTLANVLMLRNGPALVHDNEIVYPTDKTDTVAALAAKGIRTVDETGEAYSSLV